MIAPPPACEFSIYGRLELVPPFNPDQDNLPVHPEIQRLRTAVRVSDAVIVSSPEYAHGIPGALKNALDWFVSSGELSNKPVVLWSTSPSGAQFVHTQLTEVLRTLCANVLQEGSHRFSNLRQAFDPIGRLIAKDLRKDLQESLELLALLSKPSQST
jgi:chromate reductase, NAD(P)H dehydrogenase (quinone)